MNDSRLAPEAVTLIRNKVNDAIGRGFKPYAAFTLRDSDSNHQAFLMSRNGPEFDDIVPLFRFSNADKDDGLRMVTAIIAELKRKRAERNRRKRRDNV